MKILLLCGASGVGKSTIAFELCKNDNFNLIRSYTDRPRRENELDHIFLDRTKMTELLQEKVAAYTEINGYRYCTRYHQFLDDKINVYVVDANGINNMIKSFPNAEIMSVLITRKNLYIDEKRKNRDIKIPSQMDVSVAVDNDSSIESCVGTIKTLVYLHDGMFFTSNHDKVMDLQERVNYHLSVAKKHNELAKKCQEELQCLYLDA